MWNLHLKNGLGCLVTCDMRRSRAWDREIKNKKRKKEDVYALAGFSWATFMMKKNPSASITVRTESA